jgi:predicted dehydrogenase
VIKVGVIGVGHLGREHVRIYSSLPGCELAGIFDIDAGVKEKFARKYRVCAFNSIEEMTLGVDAVSVVVPTSFHHEVARTFLEAGRHVFVEKPITETTSQAEDLVKLADESKLILQVGHVERFNPVMSYLEKQVADPRFIEAHRLSPYPNRGTDVSVVLDLMIHDLDVVLHLVRSPLVSIDAVGVPVLSATEDIANARLKFANGCVANLTASRISPEKTRKIRVFSSSHYLSLDYQNQEGLIYWKEDASIKREKVPIEKDEPLKLELSAFVHAVEHRLEPLVSGQAGMRALDVAIKICSEIRKNDLVRIGA